MPKINRNCFCMLAALAFGLAGANGAEIVGAHATLIQTNRLPSNPKKPVQVFILMGQSNMVGMGDIGPENKPGTLTHIVRDEKKFPFLLNTAGQWAVYRNVYYYDARVRKGSHLSATSNNGKSIGPELGFGYVMSQALDSPVLLIKSCNGNRSLGWDLLPPGSAHYVADGRTYAGYKDSPASWIEGEPKKAVNWYAGKEYDLDLANAKAALANLGQIDPDYHGQGYQIAGFVWWQGHKDHFSPVYASRYEMNLVNLIERLRRDYNAPDARFVLATIGFGGWKMVGPAETIAKAQLAVADPKQHPELAGTIKCVEARDFWRAAGDSPNPRQDYHYYRNAETYMDVGLGLGHAMETLLEHKE